MLLQQISDHLQSNQPNQKLIIAIDSLNCINSQLQPPGTNIFYLPRYIPQGVYFLLSRRPFLSSNSGLLIEAPVQSLNLADYPEENKQDIQNYIRRNLTPLTPLPYKGMGEQDASNSPVLPGEGLGERSSFENHLTPLPYQGMGEQDASHSPLLAGEGLGERSRNETEFINYLTTRSANNFQYISEILTAIANGFYTQSEQIETLLPPGLESYYQQHLAKILDWVNQDLPLAVLQVLAEETQPISVTDIANLLDIDEFDVEEILEAWFEFLRVEIISNVTVYSLYHDNFRQWLKGYMRSSQINRDPPLPPLLRGEINQSPPFGD